MLLVQKEVAQQNLTTNQALKTHLESNIMKLEQELAEQRDEHARVLVLHFSVSLLLSVPPFLCLPPSLCSSISLSPSFSLFLHLSVSLLLYVPPFSHLLSLMPLPLFFLFLIVPLPPCRLKEVETLKAQLAGSEADRQATMRQRYVPVIMRCAGVKA